MPLKFCKTRLMENGILLERALDVLPDMAKYVETVGMKTFPDTKTKSFDVLKEAVHDPLTTAKINFVLSVAKEVIMPFMTKYSATLLVQLLMSHKNLVVVHMRSHSGCVYYRFLHG